MRVRGGRRDQVLRAEGGAGQSPFFYLACGANAMLAAIHAFEWRSAALRFRATPGARRLLGRNHHLCSAPRFLSRGGLL